MAQFFVPFLAFARSGSTCLVNYSGTAAAAVKSLKSASFSQAFTVLCKRLLYLALCLPQKPRNLAAPTECPILIERSSVLARLLVIDYFLSS